MVTATESAPAATTPAGLVDAQGILVYLFPDPKSRPSVRWLWTRVKRRDIPFIKLGKLVYFDPPTVHQAIIDRHSVTRGTRTIKSVGAK